MDESKPALEKYFDEQQVKYYSGAANFMLVEPHNIVKATTFLKENKILVRMMSAPISHTFRMSLRMMPDMRRFMEVYSNVFKLLNKHSWNWWGTCILADLIK